MIINTKRIIVSVLILFFLFLLFVNITEKGVSNQNNVDGQESKHRETHDTSIKNIPNVTEENKLTRDTHSTDSNNHDHHVDYKNKLSKHDLIKKDWLGLSNSNQTIYSESGYPSLILEESKLLYSELPKKDLNIELEILPEVTITGTVNMSYKDQYRSALGILLLNKSSNKTVLHLDYDNNGKVQRGLISSSRDQFAYTISRNDNETLKITAIELEEILPNDDKLLPTIDETYNAGNNIQESNLVISESGSSNVLEGVPTTPTTPAALSETFRLHSRVGANHTIYLDFDGHVTTGTNWNTYFTGNNPITTPAYNFDGTTSSFTNNELGRIQRIWARVAEDFSSFDVNVTTEDPGVAKLSRDSIEDTQWGVRVLIGGSSSDWYGSGGGVAYVGSFNWNDTPVFVFPAQLGNGHEKYTAEATSHEAGHALGLLHHGRTSPTEEYYAGQGTGDTSWAPIMGNSYFSNLTQWSRPEYNNANNAAQDDLLIISSENGFGYRTDDIGNDQNTASTVSFIGNDSEINGIIETRTDVDTFSFSSATGNVEIYAVNTWWGTNLDIQLELLDSNFALVATSNDLSSINASIIQNISAGNYYIRISGVGKGDPATNGYSDYASIGQYLLSITIPGTGPSPSPSLSSSPSASSSASSSASRSPSQSSSPSPSQSSSQVASQSSSRSPSQSSSQSPSQSSSQIASQSSSQLPSQSSSQIPSQSQIPSASSSVSPSSSQSPTPQPPLFIQKANLDFDGDGISDQAVYRAAQGGLPIRNRRGKIIRYTPYRTGTYFNSKSSGGSQSHSWGNSKHTPIYGDVDGDGKDDRGLILAERGVLTWYFIRSSNNTVFSKIWGVPGDKIVIGDYNGNGIDEIGIYRDGAWFINTEENLSMVAYWGQAAIDQAVPADYDGDGKTDIAIWRKTDGFWWILFSGYPNKTSIAAISVQFGLPTLGDIAVPGDYDGDGKVDVAVFRPLNGTWYARNLFNDSIISKQWGIIGDLPIPGTDADGDGVHDFTVFRPGNSTWYYNLKNNNFKAVQYGLPSDLTPFKVSRN